MLNALRKRAGSWVVKTLLLLLVVSFAVWGIGDIFFGNPQDAAVATVGESEITSAELSDAFSRSIDGLQAQVGGSLTREQAIGLGLMQRTLQDLVGQRMVDLEARELGLTVADDTLRQMITEDPTFQSAGRFDRARFQQLLSVNGLSEEAYLEALRQDAARRALTSSIIAPSTVPDLMVSHIYRHRNEERSGRFVKIAHDQIDDLPTPGESELKEVYEADTQRFTAPERRSFTFVTLAPEDLLDEIEIDDEAVQAAYEDRAAQYRTAERRTIEQLLAKDDESAAAALDLIEDGQSFEDTAAALADQGVSATVLGTITETELPGGIGKAAFEIENGAVTEPVESPFGRHIFKVTAIEEEEITPLADVREEIERELALIEAVDALPALANQLDDELAAGLSVSEAAASVGLQTKSASLVDRSGRTSEGEPEPALPPWPSMLQIAFESPIDQPSLLEETDDGAFFVLQVDGIEEAHLQAFEEVREQVVTLWEQQKRQELATERARELLTKLSETATFDTIASGENLEVQTIEPLRRDADGRGQGLDPAAVATLFATDVGEIAPEPVPLDDGVALIAADEVIEADPAANEDGVQRLKDELNRQASNDLLQQYAEALRQRYPVETDNSVLEQLMENDGVVPSAAPSSAPVQAF